MNKKMLLILILTALVIIVTVCFSLTVDLPEPNVPMASRVLDSSGRLIATIGEHNRVAVKPEEISPYVSQAIIAVEDIRFEEHHGVDPVGVLRALYHNIRAGEIVEGGSTLTQQLAKNLYLSNERTLMRKIKELYYAIQLERHYTKEEILNMYLNTVYFGQGSYGIESAAQVFFQKSAADLSLAESAMLAGFVKAPSFYPEAENFKDAVNRQKTVLQKMLDQGYITEEEMTDAVNEKITMQPTAPNPGKAGYFVAELIKEIDKVLPGGKDRLYTEGLQIISTLDLDVQNAAEEAVKNGLADKDEDLQAALAAVNPQNGYIVAMVGGRSYAESQYNRSLAERQPGSAFKPIVYAAALEQGYTAASTFFCQPVTYSQSAEEYTPTDYEEDYHYRPFTLKEALKISDNVVSVQLIDQIGPQNAVNMAKRLGISSELNPYLSLALGGASVKPLDMAAAYGVFANGGVMAKPIYFTSIKDKDGRVLISQRTEFKKAIDSKKAYIITDMLKSVLESGGTAASVGQSVDRPAAGKTGTTDNYLDAWFVGYTPEISAAVFVGYDQSDKSRPVGSGGVVAAPIWGEFIKTALKDKPKKDFEVPEGIVFKDVCAYDGLLASPASTEVIRAAFEEGSEPIAACTGDFWWDNISRRSSSTGQQPEPQEENALDILKKLIPWKR